MSSFIHNETLWLLGGSFGNMFGHYFSSSDGENWSTLFSSEAPLFESGIGAALKNAMYFLTESNGIYRSYDGLGWDLAASRSAFGNVQPGAATVHDNALYLVSWYAQPKEIWKSEDGESWTKIGELYDAGAAETLLSWRGKLCLVVTDKPNNKIRLWISSDAVHWRLTNHPFINRREGMEFAVWQDQLWAIGGLEYGLNPGVRGDIWRASLAEDCELSGNNLLPAVATAGSRGGVGYFDIPVSAACSSFPSVEFDADFVGAISTVGTRVYYQVLPNTGAQRVRNIRVNGYGIELIHTITQEAGAEPVCSETAIDIRACEYFASLDVGLLGLRAGFEVFGESSQQPQVDINGGVNATMAGDVLTWELTGNGIPDTANELGLLEAILADPCFDNGTLTHAEVAAAWQHNASLVEQQLGESGAAFVTMALPEALTMLASYLTLGGGTATISEAQVSGSGSLAFAAAFYMILVDFLRLVPELEVEVATLDTGAAQSIAQLQRDGDADGDGLSNFAEYQLSEHSYCVGSDPLFNYVHFALEPGLPMEGGKK